MFDISKEMFKNRHDSIIAIGRTRRGIKFCNLGADMKQYISAKVVLSSLSIIVLFGSIIALFGSIVSFNESLQSSVFVSSNGLINKWPTVDVFINASQVIGINNLSLGLQLDWEWKAWLDNPIRRQLVKDANFRLIRFFDFRPTAPRLMPCIQWDEASQTGVWDWTNVDNLVQTILDIGAEPVICFGWACLKTQETIPLGMPVDLTTQLPNPNSYAKYCTKWVKHFKEKGLPIRYYEIMNEPQFYFGWNPSNTTKLANYVELWNAAARSMRQENPNILISHDASTVKWVFDYWLLHGDDFDYLDFHKYDSNVIEEYTDSQMFIHAEQKFFETSPTYYGVEEARQKWMNVRGKLLPLVISESNFNSACTNGTDPRIQQMAGAVWTALALRIAILKGLSFYVYYSFSSSAFWELANKPSGGVGFGMINSDTNQPWYPYYVEKMFSSNIGVGDTLLETQSLSSDVRFLAWNHSETSNVLIISRLNEPRILHLNGFEGSWNFLKIDNSISWETAHIQEGLVDVKEPLLLNGYTVMLLQNFSNSKN